MARAPRRRLAPRLTPVVPRSVRAPTDGNGVARGPLRLRIGDQLDDDLQPGSYLYRVSVCQLACGSPYAQAETYATVAAPLAVVRG